MKCTKLCENIISLATIKGLEYILAFITFPYLVRVLQVEQYGLIVFAQSIVQYFVLLTDYGFNLLGPREIAQHDSVQERGAVFSNIFFAKLLLLFFSTILFVCGLLALGEYGEVDVVLYLTFYLMVIGNVLFPVWFFQGIQQMRYITLVNIIANIFRVAGIFLLVKTPQDYLLAALFQAIVPLIASIFSWIILAKDYPEVFVLPSSQGIKKMFVDGWSIFTKYFSRTFCTFTSTVVYTLYPPPRSIILAASNEIPYSFERSLDASSITYSTNQESYLSLTFSLSITVSGADIASVYS